jgi:hypothetical protein
MRLYNILIEQHCMEDRSQSLDQNITQSTPSVLYACKINMNVRDQLFSVLH